MKKKHYALGAVIAMLITFLTPAKIAAEDYSDSEYWSQLCTQSDLSQADKNACSGYLEYISNSASDLSSQIEKIDSQRDEIAANIQAALEEIKNYNSQIESLNAQISDLVTQIDNKQIEIDNKQEEIDEEQAQVDTLKAKVGNRMVDSQPTMRLSIIYDVMMGAKTFQDFIRIADGLSAVTDYDKNTLQQLTDIIQKLSEEKAALQVMQDELKADKDSLVEKQAEALAAKHKQELVEEEYRKQEADLLAQRQGYAANIDEIQEKMKSISKALQQVVASPGWTYPAPGVGITAGTWAYPGGGAHFGTDYGAGVVYGTSYVVSPGNGVVIHTHDGCGYGYLGNTCGSPLNHYTGGSQDWGGNEVILLVAINNSLYGVKYAHLLAGSLGVSVGDTVSGGDYLAKIGSSGNSSGPHCHIEVYYLGNASDLSNYAQTWNGDLAFGCGYGGTLAYSRICENGAGAPCRVRPESVFGS